MKNGHCEPFRQQISGQAVMHQMHEFGKCGGILLPVGKGVVRGSGSQRLAYQGEKAVDTCSGDAPTPAQQPGVAPEKQKMFAPGVDDVFHLGSGVQECRVLPLYRALRHVPCRNVGEKGTRAQNGPEHVTQPGVGLWRGRGFQMGIAEDVTTLAVFSGDHARLVMEKVRPESDSVQCFPVRERALGQGFQVQVGHPEVRAGGIVGCQHRDAIVLLGELARPPDRDESVISEVGGNETVLFPQGDVDVAGEKVLEPVIESLPFPGAQAELAGQGKPCAATKAEIGASLANILPDSFLTVCPQPIHLAFGPSAGNDEYSRFFAVELASQCTLGYLISAYEAMVDSPFLERPLHQQAPEV